MKTGYIDNLKTVQDNTGNWAIKFPIIDIDKCKKCNTCWINCPEGAISIDKNGIPKINYQICKGCGICAEDCPVKAINMKDKNK